MLDAQWHTLRVVAQNLMTLYLQAVEARGVEYGWAGVLPSAALPQSTRHARGPFLPSSLITVQ